MLCFISSYVFFCYFQVSKRLPLFGLHKCFNRLSKLTNFDPLLASCSFNSQSYLKFAYFLILQQIDAIFNTLVFKKNITHKIV